MDDEGVIILILPWEGQVKRREPQGRPEFHLPGVNPRRWFYWCIRRSWFALFWL
jgi:hypothetical protein